MEKVVQTRGVYRDTLSEDKPFFTESGEMTTRNGLDTIFSMVDFEVSSPSLLLQSRNNEAHETLEAVFSYRSLAEHSSDAFFFLLL